MKEGTKKFEGRVKREQVFTGVPITDYQWADIQVGDKLLVTLAGERTSQLQLTEQVEFVVVSIVTAANFDELYEKLGSELLPGLEPGTPASAVYSKFYSVGDINEHGVVGVGLELIK